MCFWSTPQLLHTPVLSFHACGNKKQTGVVILIQELQICTSLINAFFHLCLISYQNPIIILTFNQLRTISFTFFHTPLNFRILILDNHVIPYNEAITRCSAPLSFHRLPILQTVLSFHYNHLRVKTQFQASGVSAVALFMHPSVQTYIFHPNIISNNLNYPLTNCLISPNRFPFSLILTLSS